jgi:hypothetical protein
MNSLFSALSFLGQTGFYFNRLDEDHGWVIYAPPAGSSGVFDPLKFWDWLRSEPIALLLVMTLFAVIALTWQPGAGVKRVKRHFPHRLKHAHH